MVRSNLLAYRVAKHDSALSAGLDQDLLRHPVFRDLDAAARGEVLRASEVVLKSPERRIFRAGDPSNQVYLILRGIVRIYHRHRDGREALAKLLIAPALFGEIEVIAAMARMASADTLTETRLLCIPAGAFGHAIGQHLAFTHAVLRDVSQRFCLAGSNERDLAFNRVTPRLARLLADYSAVNSALGQSLHVTLSQSEMARDLAVTRKAVLQAMSVLVSSGSVRKDKEGYLITSPQKLAEFVDGTLPSVHHSSE